MPETTEWIDVARILLIYGYLGVIGCIFSCVVAKFDLQDAFKEQRDYEDTPLLLVYIASAMFVVLLVAIWPWAVVMTIRDWRKLGRPKHWGE